MKKMAKWFATALALVVCASCVTALAACGDGEQTKTEYTVTYYDGDTVLKTEKVEKGNKPVKWTPTKSGYTFVDWYATPNFGHVFDFDAEITENRSAFAQWASASQSADERVYYIVGSGTSPILRSSNWGKVFDDTTKMTKAADKNEYTFTLDLYKDDLFQFAINESWHNQRGVGYLTKMTLDDGTTAFSGSSTIGDNSSYRLNIKCELSGNYTFTLTTHPDDDAYETENPSYTDANKEAFNINPLDKITWVRNGDASAAVEVVTDYYIKGAGITDWKDMYNAATQMTSDNGVYTLTVYLKKDEEFMFTSRNTIGTEVSTGTAYLRASDLDEASKEYIDQKPSFNMVAKANGSYTFTYTKATGVLSVTFDGSVAPPAADYYIDGTFGETSWTGYCFNEKYKLAETAAGSGIYKIAAVALKADREIIIQAFKAGSTERGEWGTDGYNGLGSYNYTYLYGGGEAFSPVSASNKNIKVIAAGTYDITFNSYAKIITVTEATDSADTLDIYIKGENINSWSHGWSAEYLMTLSADETAYEYTVTVEAGKAITFGLEKHPKGEKAGYGTFLGISAIGESGDANAQFTPASGTNFSCGTAGTYRIVYNIETEKVDFYAVTAA